MSHSDKLEMTRPSPALIVPPPRAPEGYGLRTLEAGEEARYAALFRLAFDPSRISEIPGKLLPEGCYVIEHLASRTLAASCCAFHARDSARHPDAGQLAWLIVDPAHAKKGLGTVIAAHVTNRLVAEGYAEPFLRTEESRLAAIAIYLRLGWRPHLYTPEMRSRWERVTAALCE